MTKIQKEEDTSDGKNFADFPSLEEYNEAKKFGALNLKQYQLVKKYNVKSYATASKIAKGEFPSYEIYMDALNAGITSYRSYLMKRFDLYYSEASDIMKSGITTLKELSKFEPLVLKEDLIKKYNIAESTASRIVRGKFSSLEEFQEAQKVGASTKAELELVRKFNVKSYKIASQIAKGNFSSLEEFQEAQKVGASTLAEFKLVQKFNVDSYEQALTFQKGDFPSLEIYRDALEFGTNSYRTYLMTKYNLYSSDAAELMNSGITSLSVLQDAIKLKAYSMKDYFVKKNNIDEQTAVKITTGNFSSFEDFQEAQNVGASTVAELELVRKFNVDTYEIASQIREGGFPSKEIYKNALDYGALSYKQYLMKKYDLTSDEASEVMKGDFPTMKDFQEAQRVGASTLAEVELVRNYNVDSFEIATKIAKGKFSTLEELQEAQKVEATTLAELELVRKFNAATYDSVLKLQKAGFSSFEEYQEAQKVGASTVAELELVRKYNADSYNTVIKIQKGKFPSYEVFKKAEANDIASFKEWSTFEEKTALNETRKEKLLKLMKRSNKINQDQFIKFLELPDSISLINWLIELPEEFPIRLDGNMVLLNPNISDEQISSTIDNLIDQLEAKQSLKITSEEIDDIQRFLSTLKPGIQITLSQIEKNLNISTDKIDYIILYLLSKEPDFGEYHSNIETFIRKEVTINVSGDEFTNFLKELEKSKNAREMN